MSVTNIFVSWHTGYDSEALIHTVQRRYFTSEEEAQDYYDNLGETWAKVLVAPTGNQSFSEEWAQYIPVGDFQNRNVVIWNVDYVDPNYTLLVRYFENEDDVVPFYDALGVGDPKIYYTQSNSVTFSDLWAERFRN